MSNPNNSRRATNHFASLESESDLSEDDEERLSGGENENLLSEDEDIKYLSEDEEEEQDVVFVGTESQSLLAGYHDKNVYGAVRGEETGVTSALLPPLIEPTEKAQFPEAQTQGVHSTFVSSEGEAINEVVIGSDKNGNDNIECDGTDLRIQSPSHSDSSSTKKLSNIVYDEEQPFPVEPAHSEKGALNRRDLDKSNVIESRSVGSMGESDKSLPVNGDQSKVHFEDFLPGTSHQFQQLPDGTELYNNEYPSPRDQYRASNSTRSSRRRHDDRSLNTYGEKCVETERLLQIWILCEAQYQQHRLAHEYYAYRSFYFNFLPLGFVTTATGIISFLSTSGVMSPDAKEWLCLTVGILSITSVALQSAAQESKYRSRSEIHLNASLGMKKLKEEIDFHLVDPNIEVDPDLNYGDDSSTQTEQKIKKGVVETYRQIFIQVLDSCKSQVPIKVSQAFLLVESRLSMSLSTVERDILEKTHGYMIDETIAGNWYTELFAEISNSFMWPLMVPEPEKVLMASLDQVVTNFTKGSSLLYGDRNVSVTFKNTGKDPRYSKAKLYFQEAEWSDFYPLKNLVVDTYKGHEWCVKDYDGNLLKKWYIPETPQKQIYEV